MRQAISRLMAAISASTRFTNPSVYARLSSPRRSDSGCGEARSASSKKQTETSMRIQSISRFMLLILILLVARATPISARSNTCIGSAPNWSADTWLGLVDCFTKATGANAVITVTANLSATSRGLWIPGTGATLIGQGDLNVTGGDDITTITDDSAVDNPVLDIILNPSGTFRLAGITVQGGTGGTKSAGVVSLRGAGAIRIDHFRWNGTTYTTASPKQVNKALLIGGPNFGVYTGSGQNIGTTGVIDHNIFDLYETQAIYIQNGAGASFAGNESWAEDTDFGSGSARYLFIENNVFNGRNLSVGSRATDSYSGSRLVFRFNALYNTSGPEVHATGHSGDDRGLRATETYLNTFNLLTGQVNPTFDMADASSGTMLIWGNTVEAESMKNGLVFNVTRKSDATYCQRPVGTVGTELGWGYAGTAFTGNYSSGAPNNPPCLGTSASGLGSAWDGNTDATTGYPAIDQPGRGKGDLLTSLFPSKVNSALSNTIAYPRQALEPIYEWMNVMTPATGSLGSRYLNNSSGRVVADRDYYAQASGIQTTSSSPFNGTTGTGWGTRANRPATCTAGVAYFATDQGSWNTSGSGGQGVLDLCETINNWTDAWYTPYDFPYPGTATGPTPGTAPATSAVTSTTLTVSWGAASGVGTITYYLGRSTSAVTTVAGCLAATMLQDYTAAFLTYDDTGRTPLSTYVYCVIADDDNGTSLYPTVSQTMTCGATKVVFTDQPSAANLGNTLGTVTVQVQNASSTLCTDSSASVVLSKNSGATWNSLQSSSSLTLAATAGVATWTDLFISPTIGTGSIDANSSGLTVATSNSIAITAPVASSQPLGKIRKSRRR